MPLSKRKVIRKISQTAFGLAGLLVISSALLLWRLSSGPIQLDILTPSIQQAVSSLPGDYAIQMKGIELAWDRQVNVLQLRATRVALVDHRRIPILTIPTVNISISIAALMSRVIALSAIELKGVSIHLVRNKDGSLRLGTKKNKGTTSSEKPDKPEDASTEFHDLTEVLAHTFAALESPPDSQYPLSYLNTIDLTGNLSVEDRKLGMALLFSDIVFSFKGQENGIAGDLSLSIDSPEALAGVELEVSLLARGNDITADMDVSGMRPARLAALDPRLELLAGVDLNVNATVSGAMTLPDTVKSLELNVAGKAGVISLDQLFPEPLHIRAIELKAKADPSTMSLDLSSLQLSLGKQDAPGPNLKLSGNARSVNGSIGLDVVADIEHFQIEDLARYWPTGLVPSTRTWLTENLKVGTVDSASVSLDMTVPPREGGGALVLKKLQGKLAYSDLSVFFFRPMPPAKGVTGSGTFNQQGFDLSIADGLVGQVAIRSGRVQIKGLDVKKLTLDVKTSLGGEFADALAVLESPPIGLDKVIGFSSAEAGGEVTAEFGITLPLKPGLLPADIDYQVNARLQQASVQKLIGDFSMDNAALDIFYDPSRLGVKGSLDLDGIPIALDLGGNRDDGGELRTTINAKAAAIKPADISSLGYPVDEYFSGSFAAELDATISPGGMIDFSMSTDLGKSGLSIAPLNWSKAAGKKGSASASGRLSQNMQLRIEDLSIEAGTLSARGEAAYDPADAVLTIDLDSAALGQTSLNDLTVSRDPKNGTRINVAGGRLDLEPLLAPDSRPENNKEDTRSNTTSSVVDKKASGSAPGAFYLEVTKLEQVSISQDRFLADVSIGLAYDEGTWQSIRLNGRTPYSAEQTTSGDARGSATRLAPGEFNFNFGPPAQGNYPLSIEVENLGSLLVTALDKHMLTGGYLTVHGESSDALLTAPVSASVKLDRFTVMDVPLLAQVLNVASLDHPIETLKTKGLAFDSLFGKLMLSGQRLSTDLLRLHGGTLGVTITGNMDFEQETVDLHGGVIPLYRISNVVGKIPLLKNILVGDDGQGILALNYSLNGSSSEPAIAVIPGVLLTPKELRKIYNSPASEQQAD
ncbi:MAG: AsmA-like C-terminal domain-containing protein [Halioglobus sp.]